MESGFIDLLEVAWNKKKLEFEKTGKYEVEDILLVNTITINRELGDIHRELGDIKSGIVGMQAQIVGMQAQMLTKKFLGAVLTSSIAIMGLLFSLLQLLF